MVATITQNASTVRRPSSRKKSREKKRVFSEVLIPKKALKSTSLLFSAGLENQHVLLAALKTMPLLCRAAMIFEKLVLQNAVGEILKK